MCNHIYQKCLRIRQGGSGMWWTDTTSVVAKAGHKSNQITPKSSGRQIKSNHTEKYWCPNQIKSSASKSRSNQIMIWFENQVVDHNQNPAVGVVKMRVHRQIWHRSKGLDELFRLVLLDLSEDAIWRWKWGHRDFVPENQIMRETIKSNQITHGVKSNQITQK